MRSRPLLQWTSPVKRGDAKAQELYLDVFVHAQHAHFGPKAMTPGLLRTRMSGAGLNSLQASGLLSPWCRSAWKLCKRRSAERNRSTLPCSSSKSPESDHVGGWARSRGGVGAWVLEAPLVLLAFGFQRIGCTYAEITTPWGRLKVDPNSQYIHFSASRRSSYNTTALSQQASTPTARPSEPALWPLP